MGLTSNVVIKHAIAICMLYIYIYGVDQYNIIITLVELCCKQLTHTSRDIISKSIVKWTILEVLPMSWKDWINSKKC